MKEGEYVAAAGSMQPRFGYTHVPSLYVAFALKFIASVSLQPPYWHMDEALVAPGAEAIALR